MAYGKRKRTTKLTPLRRRRAARAFVRKAKRHLRNPPPAFKKRVLKVLNTTNELKIRTIVLSSWTDGSVSPIDYDHTSIYGGGLASGYIGTSGTGWLIPNVLAQIPIIQGTSQQQRVGNSINVKSLNLKGYIAVSPFDGTTNPQHIPFEVHMVIYKKKNDITGSPSTILEYPNNTNGKIDGTAKTSMYPWNKSQYIIKKHRVWRMKPPGAVVSFADTATTEPVMMETNGSSSNPYFVRFSVNVPIAKKLLFNDSANGSYDSKYPVNDHFSIGFYVIDGTGQAFSSSRYPAYTYLVSTLRYTDP